MNQTFNVEDILSRWSVDEQQTASNVAILGRQNQHSTCRACEAAAAILVVKRNHNDAKTLTEQTAYRIKPKTASTRTEAQG